MINIVICDDELSFQEIMDFKIRQCMQNVFDMEYQIICFNKLSDLKKHIENNKTDIIFLDIMVNDENAMVQDVIEYNIDLLDSNLYSYKDILNYLYIPMED